MPPIIINGIFTKDFPALGRGILGTDIIVVAVPGDDITYRSTAADLKTYLGVADPLTFTQANLLGTSGNYYLEFTPTTGFRPYYTDIAFADTSGYNNPFIYTRNAAGLYTQYGFTDNSAQTIKIYQVKA